MDGWLCARGFATDVKPRKSLKTLIGDVTDVRLQGAPSSSWCQESCWSPVALLAKGPAADQHFHNALNTHATYTDI